MNYGYIKDTISGDGQAMVLKRLKHIHSRRALLTYQSIFPKEMGRNEYFIRRSFE
ncbi:hypothetical protein KQI42_14195 [Tissierella sp. MSJ-40]|uniref:Uncharacterized protein n=1 Tax=Tissierella simiarum TaxID=2841534 RepID=A0ABS6E8C8_9FIRM|nr:hypothetical protein [Tissierella simiarum]MBU5439169.1 hypothetical protein [Tissierella simiarum]